MHLVNYRRLGAIVSSSPNIEYENSRRNMMAHTLVLEEIMKEFDLLPVRFGTIAPDADTIKERLLAARYQELTELLEQMRDRMELGLKAFWYDGAAIAEAWTGSRLRLASGLGHRRLLSSPDVVADVTDFVTT